MSYIANVISEMERWFQIINEKKFNNELLPVVITVQKARANNYGHFTLGKIWKDKDGNDSYYEININAFSLHRNVIDIVGTIIHECLHEHNALNGIKDFSGQIHNKKFKIGAEKLGFRVEKSKQCGLAHTFVDPNTELMDFIVNEIKPDGEIFKLARIPQEVSEPKPRKKNTFKYTCPNCGLVAKAKENANLTCNECDCELERED